MNRQWGWGCDRKRERWDGVGEDLSELLEGREVEGVEGRDCR